MPKEGNNTYKFTEFKLNSGKILTTDISRKIGIAVGLNPSSGNPEIDDAFEKCEDDWGSYIKRVNPYYTSHICENPPCPPLLLFFSSCHSKPPCSYYTINLNTFTPTKNSPIQTQLPSDIVNELS